MEILGLFAKVFCIHSMRVSIGNNVVFFVFIPIATIISSNNGDDRFIMSSCPTVIGSKVPGNTAMFVIRRWLISIFCIIISNN